MKITTALYVPLPLAFLLFYSVLFINSLKVDSILYRIAASRSAKKIDTKGQIALPITYLIRTTTHYPLPKN